MAYSQCDESNWESYYPDMEGCNLSWANLSWANLEGANLTNEAIRYFYNGEIMAYSNRIDGKLNGKVYEYHKDNYLVDKKKLYMEGEFILGEGWKTFYSISGKKYRHETSTFEGKDVRIKQINYFQNGTIETEKTFLNCKLRSCMDGKSKYYNKDGTIDKVEDYEYGKLLD